MSKLNVPFPEAGADAFLRLNLDAMEELSAAFGREWLVIIDAGLRGVSPVVLTRFLAAAIHNEEDGALDDAPWNMALDDIAARCLDAFYLAMRGATIADMASVAEQEAAEKAEAAALVERVERRKAEFEAKNEAEAEAES